MTWITKKNAAFMQVTINITTIPILLVHKPFSSNKKPEWMSTRRKSKTKIHMHKRTEQNWIKKHTSVHTDNFTYFMCIYVITFKSRQFISPCSEISNPKTLQKTSKNGTNKLNANKINKPWNHSNGIFVDCFHIIYLPIWCVCLPLAYSIRVFRSMFSLFS